MRFVRARTARKAEATAGDPAEEDEPVSFKQDTLVVPIVSTGNVGQLAVDLFLSTGRAQGSALVEKVGYLDSELVAPVAGYEVFGPGQPPRLCVNLELHRFSSEGITFLQQRGPVLAGREKVFASELVRWARDSGFKEVLALTGADAAEGLDPSPLGRGGGMKRFRAGTRDGGSQGGERPAPCALEEALSSAGIETLDLGQALGAGWSSLMAPMGGGSLDAPHVGLGGVGARDAIDDAFGVGDEAHGGENGVLLDASEGGERPPPLPTGTGISGLLCKEASALSTEEPGMAASPPLVVLLHFCSEGDNIPHAVAVAEAVNVSLNIFPTGDGSDGAPPGSVRWSSPLSWASLYGPPPSADAYQ